MGFILKTVENKNLLIDSPLNVYAKIIADIIFDIQYILWFIEDFQIEKNILKSPAFFHNDVVTDRYFRPKFLIPVFIVEIS
jgi:hypothetical protein